MAHSGSQLQEGPSGSYALERELGRCHASRHRGLRVRALAAALIVGGACSPSGAGSRPSPDSAAVPAAPASFVNRVWVVAESPQVERGEMRVFLSDSTLVMTSPHGTPAFGTWRVRNGQLTITEEGRDYPVDVVELTADAFRIRIRGPGEPVVIGFVPAEETIVELERPARP